MGYDPNSENNGINQLTGKQVGNRLSGAGNVNSSVLNDAEATKLQNELIKMWSPKVRTALRSSANRFQHGKIKSFVLRNKGDQRESKLANSIKDQTKVRDGEIYGVSFKFERHGVFVQKGVGRGYSTSGGFVSRSVESRKIIMKSKMNVNQKIEARGTINRHKEDWFNPVLIQYLPELANRLAEIRADATLNVGKLLIK